MVPNGKIGKMSGGQHGGLTASGEENIRKTKRKQLIQARENRHKTGKEQEIKMNLWMFLGLPTVKKLYISLNLSS